MNEIKRLVLAFGYSLAGLRFALSQAAFRIELMLCVVLVPFGLWLGEGAVEKILLMSSLLLVLVVELINTAVEATIDRISTDIHPLSKAAKDVVSAAVLVALLNVALVWGVVIFVK